MVQQCAGEVRIGAAMDGSTLGDSGAEQVRADGKAQRGPSAFRHGSFHRAVAHRFAGMR